MPKPDAALAYSPRHLRVRHTTKRARGKRRYYQEDREEKATEKGGEIP